MKTYRATFLHMQLVHPQSTVGFMVVKRGKRTLHLPCDLRLTCEAMVAAFGNVDVRGKAKICYQLDDAGALLAFEPVEAP